MSGQPVTWQRIEGLADEALEADQWQLGTILLAVAAACAAGTYTLALFGNLVDVFARLQVGPDDARRWL